MKNILFVFGTRPEFIKLYPLISSYKKDKNYSIKVCLTSQHKELMHDLFDFFDFEFDDDLQVMKENQSLVGSFGDILNGLNQLYKLSLPDLIYVQGDTNSAFAGALFGYYNQVKVAHVEAGLRSENIWSPFPEEGNRKMISQVASFHLCATPEAKENLNRENIFENCEVVGNTVIDTLIATLKTVRKNHTYYEEILSKKGVYFSRKILLCKMHRRENFGAPLEQTCEAFKKFASKNPSLQFIIPIHPNRNGQFIREVLSGIENIQLIAPLAYDEFVFLMQASFVLLSDSGGIQEESITCNKPILILRDNTERPEVVSCGAGVLVHCKEDLILNELDLLHSNSNYYNSRVFKNNPYGNGDSAEKIKYFIEKVSSEVVPVN
jgi:UDP-N-acetylglucosamine 2-epimerase (non-hydrolysing)